MANLPTINAFWVGPRMGQMHAACLQSFVRQGHRVVLHAYEHPEDAPKGIELADASILMGKEKIGIHRETGSLSLAADIFRFELQAADRGIYVDCDCYCVRPLQDDDLILGLESDDIIASGVLKLPVESPVLAALYAIASRPGFVPPWERRSQRRRYRIMAALGFPVPLSDMRWGTLGPVGLTYYAKKFGIFHAAKPSDLFYPVSYNQIHLLRDPELTLNDLITPRTCIVHLSNEVQRRIPEPPLTGSPLDEIIKSLEL